MAQKTGVYQRPVDFRRRCDADSDSHAYAASCIDRCVCSGTQCRRRCSADAMCCGIRPRTPHCRQNCHRIVKRVYNKVGSRKHNNGNVDDLQNYSGVPKGNFHDVAYVVDQRPLFVYTRKDNNCHRHDANYYVQKIHLCRRNTHEKSLHHASASHLDAFYVKNHCNARNCAKHAHFDTFFNRTVSRRSEEKQMVFWLIFRAKINRYTCKYFLCSRFFLGEFVGEIMQCINASRYALKCTFLFAYALFWLVFPIDFIWFVSLPKTNKKFHFSLQKKDQRMLCQFRRHDVHLFSIRETNADS